MKYLPTLLLLSGLIASGCRVSHESSSKTISALTALPATVKPASSTATEPPICVFSRIPSPAEATSDPTTVQAQIVCALRNGSPTECDRVLRVLLPRLLSQNPTAAAQLALKWEPGSLRDELLRQVIRLWMETDVGSALKWMTTLLDESDRSLAAETAVAQVAQSDPASAIELSQLLGSGTTDGSLEHKVQLWTEESPDEAVAWIISKPAVAHRDRLVARVAYVRASQDPIEASRLVLNQMTPGNVQDESIISVVHQWAIHDPAGAATWVSQLQPGPLQTRALAELETARKQSRTRPTTPLSPKS